MYTIIIIIIIVLILLIGNNGYDPQQIMDSIINVLKKHQLFITGMLAI